MKPFNRENEICNCNNLMVEIRESKKYYEKDGIVFNKETGECLGTIFHLYHKKSKIDWN